MKRYCTWLTVHPSWFDCPLQHKVIRVGSSLSSPAQLLARVNTQKKGITYLDSMSLASKCDTLLAHSSKSTGNICVGVRNKEWRPSDSTHFCSNKIGHYTLKYNKSLHSILSWLSISWVLFSYSICWYIVFFRIFDDTQYLKGWVQESEKRRAHRRSGGCPGGFRVN